MGIFFWKTNWELLIFNLRANKDGIRAENRKYDQVELKYDQVWQNTIKLDRDTIKSPNQSKKAAIRDNRMAALRIISYFVSVKSGTGRLRPSAMRVPKSASTLYKWLIMRSLISSLSTALKPPTKVATRRSCSSALCRR